MFRNESFNQSFEENKLKKKIEKENQKERNLSPEEIREKFNDPNFLPRRDEITKAFNYREGFSDYLQFCFDEENPIFEFLNEEHITALTNYFIEKAQKRN